MSSKVYFFNLRSRSDRDSKVNKVDRLFDHAGLDKVIEENDLTAIKLHFGERGNDTYINPVFVRRVVDKVKAQGAKPFLADTNTLYSGSRHNSVDHLITALEHGFGYTVTGAPIIIADGLKSDGIAEVRIDKKHFSSVKLARDIVSADSVIVMSHFKGHELTGFGGAIKNMAMGGAPASGKLEQHSCRMAVNQEKCIACGECEKVCPQDAIQIEEKAEITAEGCIGCGECITVCPEKAIDIDWTTDVPEMMERMAEYAYGFVASHPGRIGYISFLMNITPDCDCIPWSDAPIVPDIGILASTDPVAIDQACYDLVNKQVGLHGSKLENEHAAGGDKFKGTWPLASPTVQLSYAEELGMGSRDYELITL